jgi:hypothetical protein
MMLFVSRITGLILVEIFLLLRLLSEAGLCCEKPFIQRKRKMKKIRGVTGFKQHIFLQTLKLKDFRQLPD